MLKNKIIISAILSAFFLNTSSFAQDYEFEKNKLQQIKFGMDQNQNKTNKYLGDLSDETRNEISSETNILLNDKIKKLIPLLIKEEINRYNVQLKQQTQNMVDSAVKNTENSLNLKIEELKINIFDLKKQADYLENVTKKQAAEINDYKKLKAQLAKKEEQKRKIEKQKKRKENKLKREKLDNKVVADQPVFEPQNTVEVKEPAKTEKVIEDLGI